jgi:hypothetical protein
VEFLRVQVPELEQVEVLHLILHYPLQEALLSVF